MTETFKTRTKNSNASIDRWYSQGGYKKKNMKQYICELSN